MPERVTVNPPITAEFIKKLEIFRSVPRTDEYNVLKHAVDLANNADFMRMIEVFMIELEIILPSQFENFYVELKQNTSSIKMRNPESRQMESVGAFYPAAAITLARDAVWEHFRILKQPQPKQYQLR